MADRQLVPEPTQDEWDRFWEYVQNAWKEEGCWEWIGGLFSMGYGAFSLRNRPRRAHRVLYVWLNGEPEEGLQLDHKCDNKRCVRPHPEHVWPSTHRENTLRNESPPARNAISTHCIHGHEFTPENTYIDSHGWRQCKRCKTERSYAYRRDHHAEYLAKRRASRKHIVYDEQPCQHCGQPYTPKRADARYCNRRDCINSRQRENRNKRLGRF